MSSCLPEGDERSDGANWMDDGGDGADGTKGGAEHWADGESRADHRAKHGEGRSHSDYDGQSHEDEQVGGGHCD